MYTDFRTLLAPWLSTPSDEPDPPESKVVGSREQPVKPKPKK
jgi:hypothetical protein